MCRPKDHCILANGQLFSVFFVIFSFFFVPVNYGPPLKYFFLLLFCTELHIRSVIKTNKIFSDHTFSNFVCDELVCLSLCECVLYDVLLLCFSPWMVPAIFPFSLFLCCFYIVCIPHATLNHGKNRFTYNISTKQPFPYSARLPSYNITKQHIHGAYTHDLFVSFFLFSTFEPTQLTPIIMIRVCTFDRSPLCYTQCTV